MLFEVKVQKLNTMIAFEVEQLPPASVQYLMNYGLVQALNDAHASVAKKNFKTDEEFLDAVREKVAKREEQIRSGNVPGNRAPSDPSAAKVRKLVKEVGEVSDHEMALMVEAVNRARAKAARQVETRHSAGA